jgi:hypothetical protein
VQSVLAVKMGKKEADNLLRRCHFDAPRRGEGLLATGFQPVGQEPEEQRIAPFSGAWKSFF